MFVCHLRGIISFIAITFALACSSALAQQQSSQSKAVKSLLLGSVAGLVAIAGPQAADLPIKAQTVEHALATLARLGCETGASLQGNIDLDTGYIAMLGVSEKSYAMQVLKNGRHTLMIPTEQCRDLRSPEQKPFAFILSHYFKNRHQIREVYHYLMDQSGHLMNVVQFQEGRSRMYAFADPSTPLHRADFEAEKATWLLKFAALATAR
jgi:hypothetical protein